MIVRQLEEIIGTSREVVGDEKTWISRRLLLAEDQMGFSLHDTIIPEHSETFIHYKNHLEGVYCVEGEGEVELIDEGRTHVIKSGTLYALNKHDKHYLRATKGDMRIICVFNPALTGQETHQEDGSYQSLGYIPPRREKRDGNAFTLHKTSSHEVELYQSPYFKAHIGFILLSVEQTIEDDVGRLFPPSVGAHFTRIPFPRELTVRTLKETLPSLCEASKLILPDNRLNVVAYGCTSAGALLGEEKVFEQIKKGAPSARPTMIISSVIHALRALNVQRIVVGTPYLDEINHLEKDYLEKQGFEILDIQGLNMIDGHAIYQITSEYLMKFARSIDRPDAEAIFLSCGALRAIDIVQPLEDELGKPVIFSNQALIWQTLRIANVQDKIFGFGRLLSEK